MPKLLRIIRTTLSHPLNRSNRAAALSRFIRWQIGSRLLPGGAVVPFTKSTRLLVTRGMTGATGNIYFGLDEYADMAFLLHFLRPDDTFVDIGANVGSYTVLAAGEVGARSVAIEPVPNTYRSMLDNVAINRLHDRVAAHNCGVGAEDGELRFTCSEGTINHVVAEGEDAADAVTVPVHTLDSICLDESPALIKLDVEGFEWQVIEGAQRVFTAESLSAVLMELNGSGERYGFSDRETHGKLLDCGFRPHTYDPFTRELTELETWNTTSGNTLYLRNVEDVKARLETAGIIELPWREL